MAFAWMSCRVARFGPVAALPFLASYRSTIILIYTIRSHSTYLPTGSSLPKAWHPMGPEDPAARSPKKMRGIGKA
eukprot:6354198-Prymnesium_polylepis.1